MKKLIAILIAVFATSTSLTTLVSCDVSNNNNDNNNGGGNELPEEPKPEFELPDPTILKDWDLRQPDLKTYKEYSSYLRSEADGIYFSVSTSTQKPFFEEWYYAYDNKGTDEAQKITWNLLVPRIVPTMSYWANESAWIDNIRTSEIENDWNFDDENKESIIGFGKEKAFKIKQNLLDMKEAYNGLGKESSTSVGYKELLVWYSLLLETSPDQEHKEMWGRHTEFWTNRSSRWKDLTSIIEGVIKEQNWN